MPTIADLPELAAALPAPLDAICARLFQISGVNGSTVPPASMQQWIVEHFGALDAVTSQRITKVANRLTLEGALFNPLRAQRPHSGSDDGDLDALIAADAGAADIFHAPLEATPADAFGRIQGQHCVTASNVAKYDGWHGVVIFQEMHPLRWGRPQVADYLDTALRWLHAAHQIDPAARFPIITWNCLWKSGASITHGHMQMSLASDMPYAAVERWRVAADRYRAAYAASYFDDLWRLHQALGLAFLDHGGVRGYASLTPCKNRELFLSTPGDSNQIPPGLADATCDTLRALIDGQGVRSFNVALYPPPLAATGEEWHDFPWCVRIVDRGSPRSRMVDFGAMELFGTSVVTADPFVVAEQLRAKEI